MYISANWVQSKRPARMKRYILQAKMDMQQMMNDLETVELYDDAFHQHCQWIDDSLIILNTDNYNQVNHQSNNLVDPQEVNNQVANQNTQVTLEKNQVTLEKNQVTLENNQVDVDMTVAIDLAMELIPEYLLNNK